MKVENTADKIPNKIDTNGKTIKEVRGESNGVEEPKKRKISVSYTLKSLAKTIEKLEESKLITTEEVNQMRAIHEKAVKAWIGLTFNM